ncbi:hypothetical protein HO173_009942 [Letharia columbiana]|uniref:uracil phosphoribosyltransferase n=1 Tax=Letharia columbiana TaxID=112416 RepID=A0A8H6FNN6_9LECA|nr:uncharacterized protein HO173_009942 [Letharia columbiana]KAF6231859.1 hypothetical protein HO173_009942 [Letharia columbiana]
MASSSLPVNVHISTHPCLRAKLSQLRSKDANARETKALVHEIALIVGCEALAESLQTTSSGTAETPLGYTYSVETTTPHVALVPILRSGLGMLEALQTLLPEPVSVHHLGLFREPTSLQPVEYYNNLPYHRPTSANPDPFPVPSIAILLDPVIATGGTSSAAIQTLLEWGVKKVVVISVLGSEQGVKRAAEENGGESVEIWVGGVDGQINERGMIRPGLGDVGDRLFLTIGK